MDAKAMGNRIRNLREELGQTKRYVAQQLGISYSSLCQYEYGLRMPSDKTKIRLASYFGCSIEYLFFADKYNEMQ